MEHEDLQDKIVVDDGRDTEVLGRLRDLEFAAAVSMSAVAKHPERNIRLRQGARNIKQPLVKPKPERSICAARPIDPIRRRRRSIQARP